MKIEIRQVEGEKGIFTEILFDGHKLEGVRSYELRHEYGNEIPILTVDLNALDFTTDIKAAKFRQKGYKEIESIKFKGDEKPLIFTE